MSGKEEVLPTTKVTRLVRNAIIAHDLETLQELVKDHNYNLNLFGDEEKTILYFATLHSSPEALFSYLLENTNFEIKKESLLQLIKKFEDKFTAHVILLLKNIHRDKDEHLLKEKIPMTVGKALLSTLVLENKSGEKDESTDTFITWLLNKINLDATALEIAMEAKRYDVLEQVLAAIYDAGRAISEINHKPKNALPPLDAYLSNAIKKSEAECVKLLLLYGATPTTEDIEAITDSKTFMVLAQFGHAIGRCFNLDSGFFTLNDELKNTCLVGTYNHGTPIAQDEKSTILILNAADLVRADKEVFNSTEDILARVLTDWSYWFNTLNDPISAYRILQQGVSFARKDIFNGPINPSEPYEKRLVPLNVPINPLEPHKKRFMFLEELLQEKASASLNPQLRDAIANYMTLKDGSSVEKSELCKSIKEATTEEAIALIKQLPMDQLNKLELSVVINTINQLSSEDAKSFLETLPEDYINKLNNHPDLNFQLEIAGSEGENEINLPTLTASPIVNKAILLELINQLKAALNQLEFEITLCNTLCSDGRFCVLSSCSIFPAAAAISFLTTDFINNNQPDYSGLITFGIFLSLGILCCIPGIVTSIRNCIKQDSNKIINKKDTALFLAAIASFYQQTSPEETAQLADLAVQLSNNPGKYQTTRLLRKAEDILNQLNVTEAKDLPSNYKLVTIYPKSQNIFRLGTDIHQHLTFFPKAASKIKPSEKVPLLSKAV